jgi:hypothetical protein
MVICQTHVKSVTIVWINKQKTKKEHSAEPRKIQPADVCADWVGMRDYGAIVYFTFLLVLCAV